jgi:hypothetical protein
MVVSEGVKRSVDHEPDQLLPLRDAQVPRLLPGDMAADEHVTEQRPIGKRQGEGEDIGRAIVALPAEIEPSHARRPEKGHLDGGIAPLASDDGARDPLREAGRQCR